MTRMQLKNPRLIHLLGLLLAIYSLLTSASDINIRSFTASHLSREWSYNVYLPTNYHCNDNKKYPVIYALHGNGDQASDWQTKGNIQVTLDKLTASNKIPELIVVMPEAGTSWYVNRKVNMESAFIHDLLPHVKNSFCTDEKKQYLIGFSMGGYGSARFLFKYPNLFRGMAIYSPATYTPLPPGNSSAVRVGVFGSHAFDAAIWKQLNYQNYWSNYREHYQSQRVYISSGDHDKFYTELEAMKLHQLFRNADLQSRLRFFPGDHEWSVWQASIVDSLPYLFKP